MILDAVDEGLIQKDPNHKAIIKGKTPKDKKPKYLNQYELHKLIDDLDLSSKINLDYSNNGPISGINFSLKSFIIAPLNLNFGSASGVASLYAE